MVMDRITDWIVTAWELIGLLFLSGSAEPVLLGRRQASDAGSESKDSSSATGPVARISPGLHFA